MDDADRSAHLEAIADAYPYPYWYDDADEPESNPMLVRTETCDLCIVGGGYTGLWTAIIAKERDPSRDVVLLEGGAVGSAASGRNGGFMESSLTHGVGNGQERFPEEMPALERLGLENLNQIEAAIERYGIDCDYERTGVIDIAIDQPMVAELRADAEHLLALGQDVELLDEAAMQAEVRSPTYRGGLWRRDRAALVDPPASSGGSRRRPSRSACASTRTRRRRPSSTTGSGSWPPRRSGGCGPARWRSARTPSRRCCGA